jgi:nicotianamine synthase
MLKSSEGSEQALPSSANIIALGSQIVSLYERLDDQTSLAPSPEVDALFGDLVTLCVNADPRKVSAVLCDPQIMRIRDDLIKVCAKGEELLEKAWASTMLSANDPLKALARFPYLGNYEQLVRIEMHSLAATGLDLAAAQQLCFIGCGALPLTALLLHNNLQPCGATIRVVDRDSNAVELSARLLKLLDPNAPFDVLAADATSAAHMSTAVGDCDVVLLAALVGLDRPDKQTVLETLGATMPAGSHLLVRSSSGLRSLLYPPVNITDLAKAGFEPLILVHPLGDVINSVLVARRP